MPPLAVWTIAGLDGSDINSICDQLDISEKVINQCCT